MITDENIILLSAKYYDNEEADFQEFLDDLNSIRHLKKLFTIYENSGDLKYRNIVNHIIMIYNVFGFFYASNLLFFKIPEKHWPYLKSVLVYLKKMPFKLTLVGDGYLSSEIFMDETVFNRLRENL